MGKEQQEEYSDCDEIEDEDEIDCEPDDFSGASEGDR